MLIIVDTARNELIFELQPVVEGEGQVISAPADLDIGERGRLLNLDVLFPDRPAATLALDDHIDQHTRTARVEVRCHFNADGALTRVVVPRRGPGYEITYPSGNECWIDASGAMSCAITRSTKPR